MTEDEAYIAQGAYIERQFGKKAADKANYGWAVDEVEKVVMTKVYGHGIVTTDLTTGKTSFEEF